MKIIEVKPEKKKLRLFRITQKNEKEIEKCIKANIPFVFKYKNKYFTVVEEDGFSCENCCFKKECRTLEMCSFMHKFFGGKDIGKEIPEYQVLFGGNDEKDI